MGMNLYNSSPAAHVVWDSVDAHLISAYGFSIMEIVHENLKKNTIHFGGIKGQAIHECYMEMTYDTTDEDGNIKSVPLFMDINIHTLQHTYTHLKGLLFATQFVQIALVTSCTAFEDMHLKGLVQADTAFAGHSMGKFSALAPVACILPNPSLIDIVFYCGPTHPCSSFSCHLPCLPSPASSSPLQVCFPSLSSSAFSNSLVAKTTHSLAMHHAVKCNKQVAQTMPYMPSILAALASHSMTLPLIVVPL